MMRMIVALGFLIAMAQPVAAQSIMPTARSTMVADGKARAVKLARIVVDIKRGEKIGRAKYGAAFCLYPENLAWRTGRIEPEMERFDSVFREKINASGFVIAGDPGKLFDDPADRPAEYLVGGSIANIDLDVCYPGVSSQFADYERSRGTATIDVEWQIYSQIERRVVLTLHTTGTATRSKSQNGGAFGLVFDAFGDATEKLVSEEKFAKLLSEPASDMTSARTPPTGLVPLQVKGASAAPISVKDAVASAVVIFANGGEGSGFLISSDGYVLTNHHVVGGSQYVKVRWSDGMEVLGEVIRGDKMRDVALIKTDAKGHRPLHLRMAPVVVGEEIYAIGAPTGAKFQNSVTKGIVSALRVFRGYNFIQSDVAVTQGNSGGPIIDAQGRAVGMTDLGFDDAPMVNLFIPIGEAQSFLGLQVTTAK